MKEYYNENKKYITYIAETYEELVQLFDGLDDLDDDEIYAIQCDIDLAAKYMKSITDG